MYELFIPAVGYRRTVEVALQYETSRKRYKEYDKYFKPLMAEYEYRYELFRAMVEGIDSIKDEKVKNKIICTLGTNGKTTTNNMTDMLIKSVGKKTVCNNKLYNIRRIPC